MPIQTRHLKLIAHDPEHLRALLRSPESYQEAAGLRIADGLQSFMLAASPAFLARLQIAKSPDPWAFGFAIVHELEAIVIGSAGFREPPGPDGVVEIGYGIAPAYQSRGYATEAARALVDFAFASGRVAIVRAHTLPAPNASNRVLKKCRFNFVGEVIDPEDGPVWRWERRAASALP